VRATRKNPLRMERKIGEVADDGKRLEGAARRANANGLFVGRRRWRTVEELARSPLVVEAVLVTARAALDGAPPPALQALAARVCPCSRSRTPSSSRRPTPSIRRDCWPSSGSRSARSTIWTLGPTARLLVLGAIQDPGNVGVLIRTAAALSATAVVALPGTVDVWNAKVVRSAAGTHFRFAALERRWTRWTRSLSARAFRSGARMPAARRFEAVHRPGAARDRRGATKARDSPTRARALLDRRLVADGTRRRIVQRRGRRRPHPLRASPVTKSTSRPPIDRAPVNIDSAFAVYASIFGAAWRHPRGRSSTSAFPGGRRRSRSSVRDRAARDAAAASPGTTTCPSSAG